MPGTDKHRLEDALGHKIFNIHDNSIIRYNNPLMPDSDKHRLEDALGNLKQRFGQIQFGLI